MDKPAVIVITFIILAVIIGYISHITGYHILFYVKDVRAEGIVATAIVLPALFITAYIKVHNLEKNKLNKEGFNNLLEIHFGSVSNGLIHVFNDVLIELENNQKPVDKEIILMNSKRVLDNSRNKLSIFRTQEISSIPDFLDKHFPPEELDKNIARALEILTNVDTIEKKKKLVFQLIQRVQSDLLKTLHSTDYKI